MSRTPEQIVRGMGFDDGSTGPYVTELRALVARKVAEGLTGWSDGTWAACNIDDESRAKAILGMEWAVDHGHSYIVETIDGFDTKNPAPWFRDQSRKFAMHARILRDRAAGVKNPYA